MRHLRCGTSPFTPGTFITRVEPLRLEVGLPREVLLLPRGLDALGPEWPPVEKHFLLPSLLLIQSVLTLSLSPFLLNVGVRIARLLGRGAPSLRLP